MPRTESAVQSLPIFVEPMLAKQGEPFDSDRHLFEIKWDGTRGLAYVEGKSLRMMNRRKADITDRYPDLDVLSCLPSGTLLDGEVVVISGDKPDFHKLQSREQARTELKIRTLAKQTPATYVAFDILYHRFRKVIDLPCVERRELLREVLTKLVAKQGEPRVCFSEGIVGAGRSYFEAACARGLEGVVAKRLDSRYLPGKRSDAWVKIKRHETLACVIIGFVEEDNDLSSLILASDVEGQLVCVGRVGTGYDGAMRARLYDMLRSRLRAKPIIANKEKGLWVEPELCCRVSCMERTRDGHLRAPVFEGLIDVATVTQPVGGPA